MQTRRSKNRFIRSVLFLMVAGVLLVPATASAKPGCTRINELITGGSVLGFDEDFNLVSADITGDAFGGTVTGPQNVTKTTPGGVLHFTGLNTYTGTEFGDFVATTDGVVTPSGQINIQIRMIEGATGSFTANGTFDGSTGNWYLHYRGHICS